MAPTETVSSEKQPGELQTPAMPTPDLKANSPDLTASRASSATPSGPVLRYSAQNTFWQFMLVFVADLRRYQYALNSFVVNALAKKYRRSVLGFTWSLLGPLLTMAVLTVVFGTLFKRDMHQYALYILSGLLPWSFMSQSIINGSQALINNETMLRRSYLPKFFFPTVSTASEAVSLSLNLVCLFALALAIGAQLSWCIVALPLVIAVTYVFTLGAALIAAIATVYFRDLTHILTVLLGACFYLVPIVYPESMLPENIRGLVALNPFYHFICLFRSILYLRQFPTPLEWSSALLLAVLCLLAGLYLVKLRQNDIIFRL
ncbi:MAG TPA: ABC transporter permease [Candidatus Obscuribacterales bacterium]